jgi:hypothetical protein
MSSEDSKVGKLKKVNWWKVIAICGIIFFVISIATPISRIFFFRMHRLPPMVPLTLPLNDSQKQTAIDVAKDALKEKLTALGNYEVRTGENGAIIETDDGKKTVVPVVFTSNNTTLTAMVDTSTWKAVMVGEIQNMGWMVNFSKKMHEGAFEMSEPVVGLGRRNG